MTIFMDAYVNDILLYMEIIGLSVLRFKLNATCYSVWLSTTLSYSECTGS